MNRSAFRRAGIDADRARGALVHGLRHTFATELANCDVSVYTLMSLLGHESIVTSQRYVTAAGTETRTAAAQKRLYGSEGRRWRLMISTGYAGWRASALLRNQDVTSEVQPSLCQHV